MIHNSIIKTNKMMSKLLLYVLYISQIMCCVQGNMNHHLPYSLGIRDSIMIAHSFHDHPAFGPAGKMHGATYTCDVEFKTNKLVPTVNWVIDIGVASELLAEVLSKYNMKNLDEVFSNGEFTTTEFMARRIFEDLREKLRQCIQDKCSEEDQGQFEGRIKVKLFESHKAWASYEGEV